MILAPNPPSALRSLTGFELQQYGGTTDQPYATVSGGQLNRNAVVGWWLMSDAHAVADENAALINRIDGGRDARSRRRGMDASHGERRDHHSRQRACDLGFNRHDDGPSGRDL